jgi:nucleotide-binding universal stress UspA family protein
MPYRRILVPRDFFPPSERALEVALDLAGRTGADLHLLHAEVLHSDPVAEREGEAHAMPVSAVRDRLRQRAGGGAAADAETLEGDVRYEAVRDVAAAPAILRYAEEHGVDLIVMGTHGRRGVRRLLLGSVTEEVIRAASCAVLAVPGVREPTPPLNVLVPVDFSPYSQHALRRGKEVAALYGARLHALHVAHLAPYPAFYGADVVSRYDLPPRFIEEAGNELRALVAATDGPETGPVEVGVMVGLPHQRIADYARAHNVGLIVMGRRGLAGLQHILLGSTTERTLRMAPCSVLVTRLPPEASEAPAA